MNARWRIGDALRVVRNVRNDGTYPGAALGELLIRRGSVGTVVDVGTFLQDQIVYALHFLDADRIVGCREEELIGGDDAWLPSIFETRERAAAAKSLVVGGATRVPRGAVGEVLRVVRDGAAPIYYMQFDCLRGRVLAVPEAALIPPATCDA